MGEVKKEIDTAKKEAQTLKQKEKSILQQIAEIDAKIAKSERKIKKLKAREKELEKSIALLRSDNEKADAQFKQRKDGIKEKLVFIYKYKPVDIIPQVSYSLEQTQFYMQEVVNKDVQRCQELKELRDTLSTKEEKERSRLLELSRTREKVEVERKKILEQRRKKSNLIAEVRSKTSQKAKLIEELERSRARLEKLVAKLKKYPAKDFKSIIWPVRGKVVGRFGTMKDPTFGTKLINNGIDIKSTYGAPVVAVASGEVVYEGEFMGYGKIVLIDHQNGFHTLYAHLSEIWVIKGARVKKEMIIGKVGATGSVEEPILHFELRKNGKAVNPLNWIH